MTDKQLKQFVSLKREIAEECKRMKYMRSNKNIKIADAIDKKINKLNQEQLEIETFVENIDDSLIRRIIIARYIEGKSWKSVAQKIGGNNTASSVQAICRRWLRRNLS